MSWRADKPASLYFVEALDGGDQSKKQNLETEIFTWDAPFSAEPKSLMKTKQRFAGIQFREWRKRCSNGFLVWYAFTKTYFLNPKTGENKEIAERNYQDVYADPGNFQTDKNEFGQYVISIKTEKHLIGDGFTKDGQFPFYWWVWF